MQWWLAMAVAAVVAAVAVSLQMGPHQGGPDVAKVSIGLLVANGSADLTHAAVRLGPVEGDGERTFADIARMSVGQGTAVKFWASGSGGRGLWVSGTLVLRGEGGERYEISMPCLYSTGDCVRVLVLIPGYDVPLEVRPGNYSVDLVVRWHAEERTDLMIELG